MSVELIDHMGDDLRIVNSARVSFNKQSDWIKQYENGWLNKLLRRYSLVLSKADKGLINYLMKNQHGTPFEKVVFEFKVRVPIFVAREWFRHRIASYNEMSGRYVELEPDFYVPPIEAMRIQVGKPGAYIYEDMEIEKALEAIELIEETYAICWDSYQHLLKDYDLAKELARIVLPVGIYTEFYWTINLRSLLNFLKLRIDKSAMLEIRNEALSIEQFVAKAVPVAYEAWVVNGRRSP